MTKKIRLAIKRLPDTDEWRVSYLENGRLNDDKSYYATDRQDAVATRASMLKRLQAQGVKVSESQGLAEEVDPLIPSAEDDKQEQEDTQDREEPLTPPSAERLQAYLDQVLLRVFSASPGLASYIESYRVVPSEGTVELSLFSVPDEVVPSLIQAFGLPDVEQLRYTKQGSACIGFRAKPKKEDLSSLSIDDSEEHEAIAAADREGERGAGVSNHQALKARTGNSAGQIG